MPDSLKLLGIVKKAGFLEIGEDSSGRAVRAGKARLILTASDASDNSRARAKNYANAGNVPHLILSNTKYEIGLEVGRGSPGMLTITDIGLAASFVKKLAAENPEVYGNIAEDLSQLEARQKKRKAKAHDKDLKTGKRRMK